MLIPSVFLQKVKLEVIYAGSIQIFLVLVPLVLTFAVVLWMVFWEERCVSDRVI